MKAPENPSADGPVLGPSDLARYGHHLEDLDITEAESEAFLGSLFVILQAFVDMGFGVSPVTINKIPPSTDIRRASPPPDMLNSTAHEQLNDEGASDGAG